MCGIAGVLNGGPEARFVAARMAACLRHRGPDDQGLFHDSTAALAQARLSIIDLSMGHQPLSNEDETIWITFNGEIYNYRELRAPLVRAGHRFKTSSDTEVIVHAYEQYGVDLLSRLRGMFAFALWDSRRRRLLLARDHVGKKPLFYARCGDALLFASELQALVPELPAVSASPIAIDQYLTYGYVPAPATAFTGVWKLPPAHYALIEADQFPCEVSAVRYWSPSYLPKSGLSLPDAEEGLLEHLREAVRRRLIADVPVGALLSGGIDSSLVVALMAEQASDRIRTFSIGFDEARFNELGYAREVARRFDTEHTEMVVRPDALQILPTLVRHYGEPFADSSAIPSFYVSQLTRRHVKVALNGDGGDEALAGYDRYLGGLLADRYNRLPALVRRGAQALTGLVPQTLDPRSRLSQARRFMNSAGYPFEVRYARWLSYFRPEDKATFYTEDFQALLGHAPDDGRWLMQLLGSQTGPNALDRMLGADLQSYLPYDLLVKMDIAAMANSLEGRSPFLDVDLIEFTARLPAEYKIRGKTQKFLSKRLAGKFFGYKFIHRRKQGFGVPIGHWLRRELRHLLEDALLSPDAHIRLYCDRTAIRQLATEHLAGRDHTARLWALLWLELWLRQFVGQHHENSERNVCAITS